jgi:hypothetical protein
VRMHTCMYVRTYVCMYVCILLMQLSTSRWMPEARMYVDVYIYLCMHVYMYIYVLIYIHIYIHIDDPYNACVHIQCVYLHVLTAGHERNMHVDYYLSFNNILTHIHVHIIIP